MAQEKGITGGADMISEVKESRKKTRWPDREVKEAYQVIVKRYVSKIKEDMYNDF
jgi:hypothetical protein